MEEGWGGPSLRGKEAGGPTGTTGEGCGRRGRLRGAANAEVVWSWPVKISEHTGLGQEVGFQKLNLAMSSHPEGVRAGMD